MNGTKRITLSMFLTLLSAAILFGCGKEENAKGGRGDLTGMGNGGNVSLKALDPSVTAAQNDIKKTIGTSPNISDDLLKKGLETVYSAQDVARILEAIEALSNGGSGNNQADMKRLQTLLSAMAQVAALSSAEVQAKLQAALKKIADLQKKLDAKGFLQGIFRFLAGIGRDVLGIGMSHLPASHPGSQIMGSVRNHLNGV